MFIASILEHLTRIMLFQVNFMLKSLVPLHIQKMRLQSYEEDTKQISPEITNHNEFLAIFLQVHCHPQQQTTGNYSFDALKWRNYNTNAPSGGETIHDVCNSIGAKTRLNFLKRQKNSLAQIPLTLSLPECLMEFRKVILTLESVNEIL